MVIKPDFCFLNSAEKLKFGSRGIIRVTHANFFSLFHRPRDEVRRREILPQFFNRFLSHLGIALFFLNRPVRPSGILWATFACFEWTFSPFRFSVVTIGFSLSRRLLIEVHMHHLDQTSLITLRFSVNFEKILYEQKQHDYILAN